MRSRFFVLLFVFACLRISPAEPAAPQPSESFYIVRTGEQFQAPHVLTYRLLEYEHMRGRWILADVGYYDFGHVDDQLWFAGAGAEVLHGRHFTWTQELYIVQETGSAAHNQRTLWVWPILDLNLTRRLTSQIVMYPTLPLNQSARWALDIDRAKLEYAFRPHFKAGAGYSASICSGSQWRNKPFATATLNNRNGSWEVWLERMPGGAQLQLRYLLVRSEH
jgi:hypothetical protein